MAKVTIRQCPVWGTIWQHAASLAAALGQDTGTQVEVVDGQRGELTVLVDGREVARKGESLPSADEVKAAVARVAPAGAQ